MTQHRTDLLLADVQARPGLVDVMPAVLTAFGVPQTTDREPRIRLPAVSRICLLLVDGLGLDLLAEHGQRVAPFLHGLLGGALELDAGIPSSTPISLCSLGTGRAAGEHGIVGFTMHVPPTAAVIECLTWRRYGGSESFVRQLRPEALQPIDPLFGTLAAAGIPTTVVSLADHVGTALTRAAFRGARFAAIDRFDDWPGRRAAIVGALTSEPRALVYTYDARLDTAAHDAGPGSAEWLRALAATDRLARDIARALPADALLLVTGDHGGLRVPVAERVDLADRLDLAAGVAFLSGDPRARHVHVQPGRETEVRAAWRAGLDESWLVLSRDEVVATGLIGAKVRDDVRPRIGDVMAVAVGSGGIFDRGRYPWELNLVGFHGGLASAELRVPLLVSGAARPAGAGRA
jgi:predicted AlkP superfamily pyrophosphatase or phosphodiesterase